MIPLRAGLFVLSLAVLLSGSANAQSLSAADVEAVLLETARVFDIPYTVAVTNREGVVLGVFEKTGAPPTTTSLINFKFRLDAGGNQVLSPPEGTPDVAIALARTASFFSNNQAPLSSRTVRFISGIHFPPGIKNTPNAALYGIENTNRGCFLSNDYLPGKEIPRSLRLNGDPGIGVVTGKRDVGDSIPYPSVLNPGGIPIYSGTKVLGGVGVAGLDALGDDALAAKLAEFAALQGVLRAQGSALLPIPNPLPDPGEVFIDGIRLPFVGDSLNERDDIIAGNPPPGAPGPDLRPDALLGAFLIAPAASPTADAPQGWLVTPRAGVSLTAEEVEQIVLRSIRRSNKTRAAIRLTPGQPAKMVIAVGDLNGDILALYRMPDATIFSIDVAATKSRNVVYFSSPLVDPADLPGVPPGTAVTARTLSFGSQPLFPAGIGGQPNFPPSPADIGREGPFYRSLYIRDVFNPCTQGGQPANPNQSGIVFFPGSTPLYKNGVLAGGLGISGDGVEQDDYVTAAGWEGLEPPEEIRADRIFVDGVRLPYFKFPRNPERGLIPDQTLPDVLYANFNGGGADPVIDIELSAGPEIDLTASADSLTVLVEGVPQTLLPEPAGALAAGQVGVDLPFFNFITLRFPAGVTAASNIEIRLRPTDLLGRETEACLFRGVPPAGGGCREITALSKAGPFIPTPDFNRDGAVDPLDLLMLREGYQGSGKASDYDLDGNRLLDGLDLFEFGREWKRP